MAGLKGVAGLVALVLVVCSVGACGTSDEQAPTARGADMHPLAQAALAFEGNHAQSDIKTALDRALTLYALPVTDENYSRAASTLVALRKENGTAEMAILDYMIRSHVPGVSMTFPQAAAISSVMLKAGDR